MTSTARFLSNYQVPDFYIDTVFLEFNLHNTRTRVVNTMSIRRNGAHSRNVVLDGQHLTLISVKLNSETLLTDQYQLTDQTLSLALPDQCELTIETEVNPTENKALEGLYKSGDAYCTQCEAEGFRRITYFLDRPDVMAVYTTKVVADKSSFPFLLSNGNKIDAGDLAGNQHFVTWHDPHKKPCYLFALVAGNFDVLEDRYLTSEGRDVALEIYVDKGNLNKAHHAMKALKDSMRWDEQRFDLAYDLNVYMIVAVDFFNMGAMENKGLNVFNSKFVLADIASATDDDFFNVEAVIAHEYFHNWTGNRVTCRDWFQLSLKEGLTVFRDQEFSSDMHSAAVNRIRNVRTLRAHQFPEDAGPMAHPIRPEKVKEMNNFYTMTVYEKGAEVIRMIHTLLGEEKFKLGMDLYFERHDGAAVTCDDFVNAMQDASKVDLSQFRRWYQQSGTPQLSLDANYSIDSGELTLKLTQHHVATHDGQMKQDLHIPVKVELINQDDFSAQTQLLELTESHQSWTFSGYKQRPVVALLAGFSAPVIVTNEQDETDLISIMNHSTDEFCRWDAGQTLISGYIIQYAKQQISQFPMTIVDAFDKILQSDFDKAFIAEQISLPSFSELIAKSSGSDATNICLAISAMKVFLAQHLADQFNSVYQQCNQLFDDVASAIAIENRTLKNACLYYLSALPAGNSLIEQQFSTANNMTDSLAAIKYAATNDLGCFKALSDQFEQTWSTNTLVMDKWFSIQAMWNNDEVINHVNALLTHPLFSFENPNRARSLIGSFANGNPKYFHDMSGQGYEFLTNQVIKLDNINPQVASRMVTGLIQFQALDENRQSLIKRQLERINSKQSLSNDLEEKLTAALS